MNEVLATGRGLVTRVVRDDGPTVIVKERDDAALNGFANTSLETERRALMLLAPYDIAPQLLADTPKRLVLSDVGRPVDDLLFGDDPEAAIEGLRGMARAAAQLHTVPVADELDGLTTWTYWNHRQPDLVRQGVSALGLPPVPDAVLLETTGSLVLSHGDLGPNNAAVDDDGAVRLLDFEGCAVGDNSYDLAMLLFPFAWYVNWRAMPRTAVDAMADAYGPMLAADAHAAALNMTVLRLERLEKIAAEPTFRRTNQIAWTLDRAVELLPPSATTEWFTRLSASMKKLWSDAAAPAPVYPCFSPG